MHDIEDAASIRAESVTSILKSSISNRESAYNSSLISLQPYQPPDMCSPRPTYSSVLASGSTSEYILFDIYFFQDFN